MNHPILDYLLSQNDPASHLQPFLNLEKSVESLSLFSSNEELQDIATGDLKYLLLDYILSQIYASLSFQSPSERLIQLKLALKYHQQFNDRIEIYIPAFDKSIETNHSLDPRAKKIARFKQEALLKDKISELKQLCELDSKDEELERELTLTMIHLCIQKSVDHAHMLKQECDMISHYLSSEPLQNNTKENTSPIDSLDAQQLNRVSSLPASGPLLSDKGKPLRPFIITNKRQELQSHVFRPGHNLPTMSIDEYLQREMERGNFLSGGTEPKLKPEPEDEASIDAATMKAREWDEFKDHNPRGWGNRHNKG
jgi:hypothetical protein